MAEAIHLCRLGFQNDIENVDQYSDIVPSSRDISVSRPVSLYLVGLQQHSESEAFRQVSPLPNAKASGSHLRNEIDANQDVAMAQSDEDDADDMSVEDEDGQGNGVVSRLPNTRLSLIAMLNDAFCRPLRHQGPEGRRKPTVGGK